MSPRVPHYRPWWRLVSYLREGAVVQYLVSGVLVFGADYVTFFAAYQLLELNLALSTGVAYVVGLTTNFLLLRYWAFARQAQRDYFFTGTVKYALWLGLNYLITYAMLKYLQAGVDLTPYLGKFVVAFFMTFWNYAGYKLWVFKGPESHSLKFRV